MNTITQLIKSNTVIPRGNLYVWSMLLVLPSAFVVYRFLGSIAIFVYAVSVPLLICLVYEPVQHALMRRFSQRAADILLGSTLAMLALSAIIIYPLANSGWGWRATGGDRDDALILLVRETLAGRYPYNARTYVGAPISPMPGAGLLALPFVLTKQMGLQNVCWLGGMLLWLRRKNVNGSKALLALFWSILLLSPEVLRCVVTGDDLLANALYVMMATGVFLAVIHREKSSHISFVGAALFLGVTLSSRAVYLLLVPLLFFSARQKLGLARALMFVGMALAVFLVITVPFYLYNPAGFSPLYTINKLNMPPMLRWTVIGFALLVAAFTGLYARAVRLTTFYITSALVLGIPIIMSSLSTALQGNLWWALSLLTHSLAPLFFSMGAIYLSSSWTRDWWSDDAASHSTQGHRTGQRSEEEQGVPSQGNRVLML